MVSFETMSPMFWIVLFLTATAVIIFVLGQLGLSSRFFGDMSVVSAIITSFMAILGVRELVK
jgi:hypothetical protein